MNRTFAGPRSAEGGSMPLDAPRDTWPAQGQPADGQAATGRVHHSSPAGSSLGRESVNIPTEHGSEFSEHGRDLQVPAGWWLLPGTLFGLAVIVMFGLAVVEAVGWLLS